MPSHKKKTGGCSDRGPLIRKTFDGSELTFWGELGADNVGMLHFRDLKEADYIREVSIGLYGTSGEPLRVSAAVDVFLLRRLLDNKFWPSDRTALAWRDFRQNVVTRAHLGGFQYDVTEPKEAMLTNFGQGWEMGTDWEDDCDEPPVLVVMFRSIRTTVARFRCEVAYHRPSLKKNERAR